MKRFRSVLACVLCVLLITGLTPAVSAAGSLPFKDVPEGIWYYEYVSYAYDNNIMNGTANDRFDPQGDTTRAMVVTILHRIEGTPEPEKASAFQDVEKGSWYDKAVAWASGEGIVNGVDTKHFNPYGNITREQMAAILYRYSAAKKYSFADERTDLDQFKDRGKISSWAEENISWAVAVGLIQGVTADELSPGTGATRAQVAAIFTRFCGLIEKEQGSGPDDPEEIHVRLDPVLPELFANTDVFREMTIHAGETITIPENPVAVTGQFEGWYTDMWLSDPWTEDYVFYNDATLYAKVDFDFEGEDPDGDSLLNEGEKKLGTNPEKWDTDGDGLSDGDEHALGTDPLKKDTDGNGVSDYNEDFDGDGISNGAEKYEFDYQTDPRMTDTDIDGLSDKEELEREDLSPTDPDSDGDGYEDYFEVHYDTVLWEWEDGSTEEKLQLTVDPEEPDASLPVTAGVESVMNTAGKGISVDLATAEQLAVDESVPGYMGPAYTFETEDELLGATLIFRYDPSLGELGDNFQPRIYYINESNGQLEQLPDQEVSAGEVRAKTEHFSSYVLLNSVPFEAVWEEQWKPALLNDDGSEMGSVDAMFVVDISFSMEDNDPEKTFKDLCGAIISLLREKTDRAGYVTFTTVGSLASPLTSALESVNAMIGGQEYDDGYNDHSGTNGAAGLNQAILQLEDSGADNKLIFFITDGEDTVTDIPYDTLYARAKTAGIRVFPVGMGSANEEILKEMAKMTGGTYYHADALSADHDLNNIYFLIEDEFCDTATDSNNDLIPDYYSDLIRDGKLLLSNGSSEFTGFDFNYDNEGKPGNDYDHDGVANGRELEVHRTGNKVYVLKTADPARKYSDGDEMSDGQEMNLTGSNPLVTDYPQETANILSLRDHGMQYMPLVDLYDTNYLFRADQALFGAGLTDGMEKICRDTMINYFYKYNQPNYYGWQALRIYTLNGCDLLESKIGSVLKVTKMIKKGEGAFEKLLDSEKAEKIRENAKLITELKEEQSQLVQFRKIKRDGFDSSLLDTTERYYNQEINETLKQVEKLNPDDRTLAECYVKLDQIREKYTRFMDKKIVSDISRKDVLKLTSLGKDIGHDILMISKIDAARSMYEQNMDILLEMERNGRYNEFCWAVGTVLNVTANAEGAFYMEALKSVTVNSGKMFIDEALDKLLEENPYYKGYKLAMAILKLAGADKPVKSVYTILCYSEMLRGVETVCEQNIGDYYVDSRHFFYLKGEDTGSAAGNELIRWLTHMAQINMLAEKEYIDLKYSPDYNKEAARVQIKRILEMAAEQNLATDEGLVKEVSAA